MLHRKIGAIYPGSELNRKIGAIYPGSELIRKNVVERKSFISPRIISTVQTKIGAIYPGSELKPLEKNPSSTQIAKTVPSVLFGRDGFFASQATSRIVRRLNPERQKVPERISLKNVVERKSFINPRITSTVQTKHVINKEKHVQQPITKELNRMQIQGNLQVVKNVQGSLKVAKILGKVSPVSPSFGTAVKGKEPVVKMNFIDRFFDFINGLFKVKVEV